MAEKKAPGFLLERDQKEIIDELDNEEAGIIFKAIYEYETTKKIPKLDRALGIVFKQFKVKLDFYDGKYVEKCKTNQKNIQEYWDRVKNTNEYDGIQSNTMATNKRKVNKIKEKKNKEKECVSDIESISNNFSPVTPTLADIISFCSDNNIENFDCEYFYDYYEANGWVDGHGNKIKNWKSKIKTWYRKDLKSEEVKQNKSKKKVEIIDGIRYEDGRRIL